MGQTRRLIEASPERIFAVLSEPDSYAYWVVGSDTIRDADAGWPAAGTRFYHRVGWGPVKVNDHTEVLAVDPARRLQLRARARPLGTAIVTLELQPRGAATLVTMTENAGDPFTRLLFNPATRWLVRRRNDKSLRRLEELARRPGR